MNPPQIKISEYKPNNEKQVGNPSLFPVPDTIFLKEPWPDNEENGSASESCWQKFFQKCNPDEKESRNTWEPKIWHKLCPRPFCPTYSQVTQVTALGFIGIYSWLTLYAIIGEAASPPKGMLFQLILLSICAHFGGCFITFTTLPPLVGMLLTGFLMQNIHVVDIDECFTEVTNELSKVALVVILVRAGLDLDPVALRRLKYTVIKLSLIPWTIEAITVTVLSKYFLIIPWMYAILLGTIVAAVAPAVVVPCLFRLRSKGYGVAKGIPTLIIAVASIGDSTSVAVFGVIKSLMFSDTSLANIAIQGPLSIVGGIGFGILWGKLCSCIPDRSDPFLIPIRILMLLTGGMAAVFVSELVGYGGGGPLGCVTSAFIALCYWTKQGWKIDDNPVTTAFEIFWRIFQPILFSIAGARIKLNELDGNIVFMSCVIVLAGVTTRVLVTTVVCIGCKLNLKEKVFVAISWMCKAIVQAALGPVALSMVKPGTKEYQHAEKVLTTCVLSILLTVPTGALLTTLLGPRFLTKAKHQLTLPEIKRKYSRRPSIRDMSIEEENEDDEFIDSFDENDRKLKVLHEDTLKEIDK